MILHRNPSQNMAKPFTWPKFGTNASKSVSPAHSEDSFNLQSLSLSENNHGSPVVLHDIDSEKIEEAIITSWIEEAQRQDQLDLPAPSNATGSSQANRKQTNAPGPDFSFSRRVAQHLMAEFPQATFGWLCRHEILPNNVTPAVLREHARALVARIQFVKNTPG